MSYQTPRPCGVWCEHFCLEYMDKLVYLSICVWMYWRLSPLLTWTVHQQKDFGKDTLQWTSSCLYHQHTGALSLRLLISYESVTKNLPMFPYFIFAGPPTHIVGGARLVTVAGVCRRHLSGSVTPRRAFSCAGQVMTSCGLQSNYSCTAGQYGYVLLEWHLVYSRYDGIFYKYWCLLACPIAAILDLMRSIPDSCRVFQDADALRICYNGEQWRSIVYTGSYSVIIRVVCFHN